MWICEQKYYNDGKVKARVYHADSPESISSSDWFKENTLYQEERKSFDIYYEAFMKKEDAINCQSQALAENA